MRKEIKEIDRVDKELVSTLQHALEPVFGKLKLRKSSGDGVYMSYYFKVGKKNVTITVQDDSELSW
jgi:hypothetical protein